MAERKPTAQRKRKAAAPAVPEGRVRAVIDALLPAVDGGRFPAKRIAGEAVAIEAHCFADGHDKLRVMLRWGAAGSREEYETEMKPQANDVWQGEFTPPRAGLYRFTVSAWVDPFESWRRELDRREDPADIRVALQVGAALIDA
ncbi:MAG: maltotransferase domain-containing protein, partial [Steroidobacteraceae bacterium]